MSISVFIDGGHGTTGLEIRKRLTSRTEIALIEIDDAYRKDDSARKEAFAQADIAILCLPDDAARAAIDLMDGTDTRVIDTSTAHRTAAGWSYGLPEWRPGHRATIAASTHVANPGCYAQTFVALTQPLVHASILPSDARISCNAVSGYSGGGKAMIAEFENDEAPTAFRNYALGLAHKHLPEMQRYSGLAHPPLFSPSVTNLYSGMLVEIPLCEEQLTAGTNANMVRDALQDHYADSALISVQDTTKTAAATDVSIESCVGTDRMEIFVFANPASGLIRLCAVLDNLGKGAAGSAAQNLNLLAGFDEYAGLSI